MIGTRPVSQITTPPSLGAVDRFVKAFEAAWAQFGPVDVRAFLPLPEHTAYLAAARELLRVDMELRWGSRQARDLDYYRRSFPAAFRDRAVATAVAFEEFRLRREHGETPDPAEYAEKYGIVTDDWSVEPSRTVVVGATRRAAAPIRSETDHGSGRTLKPPPPHGPRPTPSRTSGRPAASQPPSAGGDRTPTHRRRDVFGIPIGNGVGKRGVRPGVFGPPGRIGQPPGRAESNPG